MFFVYLISNFHWNEPRLHERQSSQLVLVDLRLKSQAALADNTKQSSVKLNEWILTAATSSASDPDVTQQRDKRGRSWRAHMTTEREYFMWNKIVSRPCDMGETRTLQREQRGQICSFCSSTRSRCSSSAAWCHLRYHPDRPSFCSSSSHFNRHLHNLT